LLWGVRIVGTARLFVAIVAQEMAGWESLTQAAGDADLGWLRPP